MITSMDTDIAVKIEMSLAEAEELIAFLETTTRTAPAREALYQGLVAARKLILPRHYVAVVS